MPMTLHLMTNVDQRTMDVDIQTRHVPIAFAATSFALPLASHCLRRTENCWFLW